MAGEEWIANSIAPNRRSPAHGAAVALVVLGTVVFLAVIAIGNAALGPAAYVLLGLGFVIIVGAGFVWRSTGPLSRSGTPDAIRIGSDRVEGRFSAARGVPARVLRINFRSLFYLQPSGRMAHGGWFPGTVEARYFFDDPGAVRTSDLLHGPPTPPGCARSLTLSDENVARVREALMAAYPDSRQAPDGRVFGPAGAPDFVRPMEPRER